ncbi:hypothetical protein JZ751_016993 [Albula glossodonta]|uniref:WW domain-binding protein 11 n=1 Tax=Albula glossodonta TaxID=121402 RepID=A0A8T2N089_9TELE|nr:hypothetical protein JZ751_016993 [Albula glossodonta]
MGRRSTSSTKSGKFMNPTDQAQFNPVQVPLLNEKVLRDKRKKLRETFERIVRLYERENPDTYKELRKLELDYESKRGQLALYFHSVKDIPLPGAQPPSILKKSGAFGKGSFAAPAAPSAAEVAGVPRLPPGRKPPGPPPGPPPPQVLQLYRAKAQNYSADMGTVCWRVCTRLCVRACVCACQCACVCMCVYVCACVRACVHVCERICVL